MQLKVLYILLFLLSVTHTLLGQQNFLSLNDFYKDRLYHQTKNFEGYRGNSFFPVTESRYNLEEKIKDTSKQYYLFTEILFRRHLIEVKGKNYHLAISPVLNMALGKDFEDSVSRKLFQNTRGFHIEGDLFQNFSFSTSFYENQSRNVSYQSNYFTSNGERYINPVSHTYYAQNAVVNGLGRTKPFKQDAFDYAFAMGDIIYRPIKVLTLSAGNTRKFIGDGYRSLLLSDNTFSAPNFQINYQFAPRFELIYMRSKLTNLLRRPASTTVEAYYDPKVLAVNYLSFQVTKDFTLSLFEGSIYSKGDSIVSKRVSPMMYNPIPFLGAFVMKDTEVNSILGLNLGYTPISMLRLYGQVAFNNRTKGWGVQLGGRLLEPFKVKNLLLQLEGNYTSDRLYSSVNPRLNYSHFNLPLAHVKGQNFTEMLVRVSYEYKRAYVDVNCFVYQLKDYHSNAHLALYDQGSSFTGTTVYANLELGYRFNRKMNLSLFGALSYRNGDSGASNIQNTFFHFGLKTGFINTYRDF